MHRYLPADLLGPDAPTDDILTDFRAVDARAELIGIGGGVWWLGVMKPADTRVKIALAMLKSLDRRPPSPTTVARRMRAILALHGFAYVATYDVGPAGTLGQREVDDFRIRERNFVTRADATFEQHLNESSTDTDGVAYQERMVKLRDAIATEGKAALAFMFKNPVSIASAGIPAGGTPDG
jgi:hypothetical protein